MEEETLRGHVDLRIERTKPFSFENESGNTEYECLKAWLSHPSSHMSYVPITGMEYDASARFWMQYAAMTGLTVYQGENPVAMGVLQVEPFSRIQHTAELSIIVDPEMQRRGIGKALVETMCDFGKKVFKLEGVHLQVHAGSNAYRFYKALGFEEFGRQKKWIKEEDETYRSRIFMEKRL